MNELFLAFMITVKRHLRSATPFIMQVLGSIMMIIIMGSSLQGSFNSINMDPLKVAVVNEDSGQISKQLLDFLKGSQLKKLVKISTVSNIENAKKELQKNKYNGVIEIKSDYSRQYMQGNFNGIKTFLLKKDNTSYQILSSILNGWINNSAAIQIGLKNGEAMNTITSDLQSSGKMIEDMPLTKGGRLPRAIDYYSVTIVVMTLLFSGFLAMGRLQEDFLSEMKHRFETSPAKVGYLLTGELLGTTCMSFLQMLFVAVFTHFVYGANWGTRYGIVLGTMFLMALFGQLLAGAFTLGLKNANAPQAIIGSLAMGLEFLAGGFYASPIGGAVGKFLVTYGTPNSLAQTAIFGSIYGGNGQIIYMCMGILAGLSLLLLGITIIFARRRVLA